VSRRAAALLVAACVAILLGTCWLWRRPSPDAEEEAAPEPTLVAPEPESVGETWSARLWFPADTGRLGSAEIPVTSDAAPAARATAALSALLAARPEPPLAPVFPDTVEVHKVLFGSGGVLFVDLRPPDGSEPPGSGSTAELQRVYAVVHSALDAVPEASAVVLLWNGVQRRSLAGHVDTARPLRRFAGMEPR